MKNLHIPNIVGSQGSRFTVWHELGKDFVSDICTRRLREFDKITKVKFTYNHFSEYKIQHVRMIRGIMRELGVPATLVNKVTLNALNTDKGVSVSGKKYSKEQILLFHTLIRDIKEVPRLYWMVYCYKNKDNSWIDAINVCSKILIYESRGRGISAAFEYGYTGQAVTLRGCNLPKNLWEMLSKTPLYMSNYSNLDGGLDYIGDITLPKSTLSDVTKVINSHKAMKALALFNY